MKRYFGDLFNGAWSLVVGLGVTLKALFQPHVTVHYPRQKLEITPQFRGHTELFINPETGSHKCISCGMCMRECPSDCIYLESEKKADGPGKNLTVYTLDFTKCSLCGTCVEICPTQALRYSREYELASSDKGDFRYDLLKRLETHP